MVNGSPDKLGSSVKGNFTKKVIRIIKQIPYGKVTTYGEVALLAGFPRGARIVGWILHSSKGDIPWHRVINRHGFISIKSSEHPKQLQKVLLEQEGVEVSDYFIVDLNKYGWK